MTERVLRAYYDLAVSPPSYDVCVFLYRAEMERIYLGLDAFDLIVVANRGNGFRHNLVYQPLNDMNWRLHHIVLPAHRLVPSCRRVIFYPDRNEAVREFDPSNPTFPAAYKVGAPIPKYLDSVILTGLYNGLPPATLRAPPAAVERMKSWVDHRVDGRKAIVISLRTEQFQPMRNSNIDAWVRFARSLDQAKYLPIFVRDTAALFKPPDPALTDLPVCDPAALDIELRLALYEIAHINLFVDSGPSVCCMLDELTRCIRFKLIASNNPHAGTGTFLRRGYSEGMQWAGTTTHQISIWEEDTFQCIAHQFSALESNLQSGLPPKRRPLPPITRAATNFIAGANHSDASMITSIALAADPTDIEARFLYATSLMHTDEKFAALKEFKELFAIPQAQNTVLIPFATCLWATGRVTEAVEILVEAGQKRDDDVALLKKIARLLLEIGEHSAGAEIIRRLLEKLPNDAALLALRARHLMRDDATITEAMASLNNALKFRPDDATLHFMFATCLARLANFELAIQHARTAIALNGRTSLEYWINIGSWLTYLGDNAQADISLSKADAAIGHQPNTAITPTAQVLEWLAGKARIAVIRNRTAEARSCYRRILELQTTDSYVYPNNMYLDNTPARLRYLREIVRGRDVFIFCNGHSISRLKEQWVRFAGVDACIMAASQFHEFETTFLAETQTSLDVAIVAHEKHFQKKIGPILEFLSRNSSNLLITRKSAVERLGRHCPPHTEIERRFNDKLLYVGELNSVRPATPNAPLRFLCDSEVYILTVLAAISGARRLFLFSADRHVEEAAQTVSQQSNSNNDLRDIFPRNGPTLSNALLAAEMKQFAHNLDVSLIAAEHLFGIDRPPIYNVSFDNLIDLFPRIDYDDALELLANTKSRGVSTTAIQ
jgi:tetratricopeptide (TPR) repeat protein